MIRWSFLLPRLVLAAAALVALHFGLGPVARWALIQGGQAALGGKIEIGRARVDLAGGRVAIDRLQVSNPRSPLRNLVEFEEGEFLLDRQALLRRRLVIDQGTVRGLLFDGQRAESGALPEGAGQDGGSWSQAGLEAAGRQWLDQLADRLDTTLQDELETVRLSKQLMVRWPAEYEQIERKLHGCQSRAEGLRRVVEQPPRGNVLEQTEFYREQLIEAETLRRQLVEIRGELTRLWKQADQDRIALDAARRRDAEHLRQKLQLENLDPESLSVYLLGEESGRLVSQTIRWVQSGRSWLNAAGEAPEMNHGLGRGMFVNLTDGPLPPDLLIRRLDIAGRFRHEGGLVPFHGTARGVTHQPRRHDEPLVVEVALDGESPGSLSLVVEQGANPPRSRMLLQYPRIPRPGQRWGDAGRLEVGVAPGVAELGVELQLIGNRIEGRIVCRQPSVELTPRVAERFGGAALARPLQTAAREIKNLELVIPLRGELSRPRWSLESNVGAQLAAGFNGAIRQELANRATQLTRQADRVIQQELARCETVFGRQAELQQWLRFNERQVDEFKQWAIRRSGAPAELLGRELPFGNLFKK